MELPIATAHSERLGATVQVIFARLLSAPGLRPAVWNDIPNTNAGLL